MLTPEERGLSPSPVTPEGDVRPELAVFGEWCALEAAEEEEGGADDGFVHVAGHGEGVCVI